MMNKVLWVLQVFVGLFFVMVGINHLFLPPNLPAMMGWMYDLTPTMHYIIGPIELLGGLGLILPGLAKIQTKLTPLAAAGLALVMVGAVIFHITRGEAGNAIQNIVLIAITGFIAYMRWTKHPLPEKSQA
jgi:uncharacterized membrane protein